MTAEPIIGVELFYCYAREDIALHKELDKHLSGLKDQLSLRVWHNREIRPGVEWEQEIHIHLNTAHIILLLVSPDFMASEYCSKETNQALKRHEQGSTCVIPILLRPVNCEGAPFSSLHMLPTNAKPITMWANRDQAYSDIAEVIREETIAILAKQWRDKGNSWRTQKEYEQAIAAYEQAIRFNPSNTISYDLKGRVLVKLRRFEEAIAAFGQALTAIDEAISLDHEKAEYHYHKGRLLVQLEESEYSMAYDKFEDDYRYWEDYLLVRLERYKKALAAFNKAIGLDPMKAEYHYDRGKILVQLKRSKEALAAVDQAISLHPTVYEYNSTKVNLLKALKQYEKDLAAIDEAISLDPEKIQSHYTRGSLLVQLDRYEEALIAFDQVIHLELSLELSKKEVFPSDFPLRLSEIYEEKIEIYEMLIQQTRDEMGKHRDHLFFDDDPLGDHPF